MLAEFRCCMTSKALHRFAVLSAGATLLLVVLGGLVTSHGVGMAVPDWPNTYGYNMFFFPFSKWVGGIFYEHSHRLVASAVGLLTGILAVWLYGRQARPLLRWLGIAFLGSGIATMIVAPARRADCMVILLTGLSMLAASFVWPRCESAPRWLRRLGLLAFLMVVVQGVLGGLRVVLFKDELGIVHAALAQLFFALVCAIALFTSKWWTRRVANPVPVTERVGQGGGLRGWFVAGTALIFFQLVLGATMRHQHAGLAIPDFPLAYGKVWPAMDSESIALYNSRRIEITEANPITSFQVGLQMAHRASAVAILMTVAAAAWSAQRSGWSGSKLAYGWVALIGAQVLLGAATIWSNKAADVATAHVLVGALSLATGAILSIVSSQDSFARKMAGSRRCAIDFSAVPAPHAGCRQQLKMNYE